MKSNKITIIYDGGCPFCSDFVALSNLRTQGYEVNLLNARDSHNKKVQELSIIYDLDDGMLVLIGDDVLFGADAAHFLSQSSGGKTIRGGVYKKLLSNQATLPIVYKVMVFLRKTFFKLTGRALINEKK